MATGLTTERIKRAIPPLASALRETLREGYHRIDFRHDVLAGLAVGIIAVPLSLALAIASGVPREAGYLKESGKRWYYQSSEAAVKHLAEIPRGNPPA